jgi:MurNAc alpha-1-phosphate uridylyltransferase
MRSTRQARARRIHFDRHRESPQAIRDASGLNVKAMILAAGRGERMRPLTDEKPKPLLEAGGKPLVVWLIESLARANFTELVINVSHLGQRIEAALGDGRPWGVHIQYSRETEALETAGGIATALPLLGREPFAVVNGDVYTDFDFSKLKGPGGALAHLVLIDNPPHHPVGDFALERGLVAAEGASKYTFSGIGVYEPSLFADIPAGTKRQLAAVLRPEIANGRVSGEHFRGRWLDVGTPERLAALDRALR